MEKGFKLVPVSSWDQLVTEYQQLQNSAEQWIFRGHRRSDWALQTTLERAIYDFGIDTSKLKGMSVDERKNSLETLQTKSLSEGLGEDNTVSKIEGGLLRRFQRQCHHFTMQVPDEKNILEWLALMQHYKAPTRLLDWTFSFFVAVYFGVEYAESACAVWAFNTNWLARQLESRYREEWKVIGDGGSDPNLRERETFEFVFQRKKALVVHVNPFRLNERSVIQQGIFLCPGDVSKSFEDNLSAIANGDFDGNLIKFEIVDDSQTRQEIIRNLHRMNMNRGTLFPGLDGFGESLRTLISIPRILTPDFRWPK